MLPSRFKAGPLLLSIIAGVVLLANPTRADSCMTRWLRLAGDTRENAIFNEKRMGLVSADETNYLQPTVRLALSLVLKGGRTTESRLRQCMGGKAGKCRSQPPCTRQGKCVFNRDSQLYQCRCNNGAKGRYCHGGFPNWLRGGLLNSLGSYFSKWIKSALKTWLSSRGLNRIVPLFTDRKIDGGGWKLVWKHSYLQVPRYELSKAKTFSSYYRPCTDLDDGWCNVPVKQLPGAKEMMLAAYHKKKLVYAYKSPLNSNLGKTELGARLVKGWSKVTDKCRNTNGVRPDVSRHHAKPIIIGLSFDKVSPNHLNHNCDTVWGNYQECRWHDCALPRSISHKHRDTQMTLAIFVR